MTNNLEVLIHCSDSSSLCGIYDSDVNGVYLHLDHHFFSDKLSREDIDEMINNLSQLKEMII